MHTKERQEWTPSICTIPSIRLLSRLFINLDMFNWKDHFMTIYFSICGEWQDWPKQQRRDTSKISLKRINKCAGVFRENDVATETWQLRKLFLFFLLSLHAPSKRGIIIKVQSPSSSLTNTNTLTTAPTLAGTRGESAHCPYSLGFESRGQEICATCLGQTRNEAKPRTGEDVLFNRNTNK